ncbi:hypothetical protein [Pseudobacteroides cellulosolvens]|uniref:Uncharacterized protein n=1 Tax=Pseudobacteroides cellulosolvens ATCC 35603 = DSM 2933 TaxID=398512 RepID=A0A0L6JR26_9FIRM|nr:hypothetical protein [Pseudobacteroides cellulosolvens]KNY28155.1 hypothetical protein Bccel_3426 [Pseudobacteroides cellulosolvens ATCC 35603 = DSM 2933]
MVNMDKDFDFYIQKEIQYCVKDIKSSEEMLECIFSNLDEKKSTSRLFNLNLAKISIVTVVIFILSSGLIFTISPDTRVMAMEIIKKVFVIDKNDNLVEKNAEDIILQPAVCDRTNLSDEELSLKMGINVHFPKTLCEEFSLVNKLESVGVLSPISYNLWDTLKNDIQQSIHNEQIFKGLQKYMPYRSACGVYQNSSGITFGISVSNKDISQFDRSLVNVNSHEEINIGNTQAIWDDVSYPDYTEGNMAKKPTSIKSVTTLTFYFNGATYMITSIYDSKNLSKESAIKYAQAFLDYQKL